MYISILSKTVTGTPKKRRNFMKEYFINQMGGECVECHTQAVWELVFTRQHSGKGCYARKCNLEAHHIIRSSQIKAKDRLANLYVVTGAKKKEQKAELRKFAVNLESCVLLCKQCHGSLHGKQKVDTREL